MIFYYFTLIKQKMKLAVVFQNDFLDLMILQQIINSGSDGDRMLKIDAQLDPTFYFVSKFSYRSTVLSIVQVQVYFLDLS